MFRLMRLGTWEILKGDSLDDFVVTYDGRVLEKVPDGEGYLLEDRSEEFGILRVIPNG